MGLDRARRDAERLCGMADVQVEEQAQRDNLPLLSVFCPLRFSSFGPGRYSRDSVWIVHLENGSPREGYGMPRGWKPA
jgi:hypothetical protein